MTHVHQHDGQTFGPHGLGFLIGWAQGHQEQAVDSVAAGKLPERIHALGNRFDVEQQEVIVLALAQALDDAAQPLQHRPRREEGRHHADRLCAPE